MSKKTSRVKMAKGRNPANKHAKTRHPRAGRRLAAAHRPARIHVSEAARAAIKLKNKRKEARLKEKAAEIKNENTRMRVDELLENAVFSEFISKNVGRKAINVIKLLNAPQTDEKLAADLEVKINEVRRILNVLDSYGVARYDTNKDNKGWLTFKWYLDCEKLGELHQNVISARPENGFKLPDNCNDFFYCGRCYSEQKIILPFDAAFEAQFKCDNCSRQLKQLNKEEARELFEESVTNSSKESVSPA